MNRKACCAHRKANTVNVNRPPPIVWKPFLSKQSKTFAAMQKQMLRCRGEGSTRIARTSSQKNQVRTFTLCSRAAVTKWHNVAGGAGIAGQSREPRNRVATWTCATAIPCDKRTDSKQCWSLRIHRQKADVTFVNLQPGGIWKALYLACV